MKALRDIFGLTLKNLGKKNKKLIGISCDLKAATKMSYFFEEFPDRSFEVGIAEANAISISAGLALSGFRPVISSFAAFITGKNVEIRTSLAYNDAPVVIIGTHGGLIGPDGATQSGLQDISVMRTIPNMKVFQPSSPIQTESILEYSCNVNDLIYIRIARNKVPEIYNDNYKFFPKDANIVHQGDDLTIFSSGPIVHSCIEAAKNLKKIISIRVCDISSLKPINEEFVIKNVNNSPFVFTFEDHNTDGGLGTIISEVLSKNGIGKKLLRFGLNDEFIVSGKPEELERHFMLDSEGIINTIKRYI